MALVKITAGDQIAFGYDTATGEKGTLLKIAVEESVVKGNLLAVSATNAEKYKKQTAEFDVCCVAAEAGSANASIWAWTTGSICEVLYKTNTASTMGWVCVADAVDGLASDIDLSTIGGTPADAAHFKEIGHVKETVAAGGAGVSNLVLIHFHTL